MVNLDPSAKMPGVRQRVWRHGEMRVLSRGCIGKAWDFRAGPRESTVAASPNGFGVMPGPNRSVWQTRSAPFTALR